MSAIFSLSMSREDEYTRTQYWRNPVRNKLGAISLLIVGFLAASLPLFAHHGNASYDTEKTVTVKGAVTEYIWANPHVFVKVDGKDDSGNTVHWVIEAQNLVQQSTLGWTNTTFKPSDQVVIDFTDPDRCADFGAGVRNELERAELARANQSARFRRRHQNRQVE